MPRPLQTVLDALLEGVAVLDDECRVEGLNAEACRILETSEDAVVGHPVERLLGAAHPIATLARQARERGRSAIQDEVTIERRLAEPLVADVAVSPFFDDAGRISGSVVILGDRTISNSLRNTVAERERLSAWGQIAAGIAHEVKNPLSGIRGAAELLELRAHDDRAKQTAGLIVREVDRIASLVDELMVFAKGEGLDAAPVNLHRVIDDTLELIELDPLARDVSISRVYDPSIPEILADANRLTQVLLNLARNAVQAMAGDDDEEEDRPRVLTVTTRVSLDHRLPGDDGRMLPAVVIVVSDTGRGIEPEDLERASTPFFTTRASGTGLGLAVARHWVTQHRGTLDIQSARDRGTSVRIALPMQRSEQRSE